MATVTLTASGTGQKKGAGLIVSFNIGGGSIPAGSTINGITLKLRIARSSTGPSASEILVNVVDDVNDSSTVSTTNATSATLPPTFPTFNIIAFGSDSELFGLSTWTPGSFEGLGFEVRITHNGSTGILYWEPIGTEAIIDFTPLEIPRYNNAANNIHLQSGNINISSGNISI
tara:strand:- start:781 stop:1299 length:519 start_codon:yes stop_codon:yes gene_type:complete